MTTLNAILFITALTSALIAGLFYSYSCSVNPGLRPLSDLQYLSAMQSINRAILNPMFFFSFMGTLILLPICTYMHYGGVFSVRFYLLVASTITYIFGVFGVTVMGNVPLNDALEQFNIASGSVQDLAAQRLAFEKPWNKLHQIRTIASVISFILILIACLNAAAPGKQID